jgi:glycine cleavage system aminomethyltransferase T
MVPELFNMRFKHSPYVPFDPSVTPLYSNYVTHAMMGGLQPFVYTDWRDEELSWHHNCYIHAGLNPMPMVWIKGRDALKFLSEHFVNGFAEFPIAKIRHGIMTNQYVEIMCDGLIIRIG